jgi:hypothetical protein
VAHKNTGGKGGGKSRKATVEDASDDEDYAPPKRSRQEPHSPDRIFDSDGNENEELTEAGIQLV